MNKLGMAILVSLAVLIRAQGLWAGSCCLVDYRKKNVLGEVCDIRKDINRLYVIEDNTRTKSRIPL